LEKTGIVQWKSPSNIAIVKYWGKKAGQIPMNASLSFTLSQCITDTKISYSAGNGKVEFFYEGQPKPEFFPKVRMMLDNLNLDFLKDFDLIIESSNNFPHSAGIASSASAMSALALCITDMQRNVRSLDKDFLSLASLRARIGSGSACRSVFGGAALWGKLESVAESTDEMALPWKSNLHSAFSDVQDWIFIVSAGTKNVSSSAGHKEMNSHYFRTGRITQAQQNIIQLIHALKEGDWNSFIEIAEMEALSLHALMMSGNPGYLLLEPESIRLIHAIRQLRKNTGWPVCFTIDAGPNIHVLFPKSIEDKMTDWCFTELPNYSAETRIIKDHVGNGPVKVQ